MIYINTNIDIIDLSVALPTISEQRRKKALSYKNKRDQKLSVAVYLLLKQALKEEYGIEESPVFGYEEGGKPYIIGHQEICFNMSHCRSAAICAIDSRPIGVDIETIRPFKETLAHFVLNDEEYQQVVSADRQDVEFIKLWTMKESLLKLTGTGLRDDLKTLLPCDDVDFHTLVEQDFIYTVCQMSER